MVKVSIIIVHYRADTDFFACLRSLEKNKPFAAYEVIVVDNDEITKIESEIKLKFPRVKYIKSLRNIGFGAGSNLGVRHAKGQYLFFLNPDTLVFPQTIDVLASFLDKKKDAAIVAPLLLHEDKKPFVLQGNTSLTPLTGMIGLSLINKLMPDNAISRKYWLKDWKQQTLKEVEVVPGTAFMIRTSIFASLQGFDEKYFLYFEEFDLCKRVRNTGQKIFINPQSKIIHLWGRSTKERSDISAIFARSRFYYFRKHFGILNALLVEGFSRFGKIAIILLLILITGLWLRIFKLNTLMPFNGDQGWFYLSARNLLLEHKLPLEGAFWTYILGLIFSLTHFAPLAPGYFTVFVDILTIWLVYKFGSQLFSPKTGLIAALIYAVSPLTIIHSRMPDYTSLISLLTVLFYMSLYKWLSGNRWFFPLSIFLLTVLYNFAPATGVLWPVVLLVLVIGIWKKKPWLTGLRNRLIIALSVIAVLLPLLPVVIFTGLHGFSTIHTVIQRPNSINFFTYLLERLSQLIFLPNIFIALALVFSGSVYLLLQLCLTILKKNYQRATLFLAACFFLPALALLLSNSSSEVLIPVIFPATCLVVALLFTPLFQRKRLGYFGICLLVLFSYLNGSQLLREDYLMNDKGFGLTFTQRLAAANRLIEVAGGRKYNINDKMTNYAYLTWWKGNGPANSRQKLSFTISEDLKTYTIKENQSK